METAAFKTYWNKFKKMDVDAASNLGAKIARTFGPLSGTHKTAMRNIQMCFPRFSDAEVKETLTGMWDNLGRLAGEMPHVNSLGLYSENSHIKINHLEILDSYKDNAKGGVFISGHFANWEVMAAAIVQRNVNCEITYRAMNNPEIDEIIRDARTDYGVKLLAAKGREGGLKIMRILAKGGSVAMMNDQKYNMGIKSKLFGYDCMTNDAAIRFAHRFKIPIQAMTVKRTNGANFEVDMQPPVLLDFDAPLADILQSEVDNINKFIEQKVREAPEQWFWVHKRWPKQAWIDAGVI